MAKDILKECGQFHEALFDVQVLEKLTNKLISTDTIFRKIKLFHPFCEKVFENDKVNQLIPSIKIIKDLTNVNVCKKMISSEISYQNLETIYQENGKKVLIEFLSEKIDKRKYRVTNKPEYLENIVQHFKNKSFNIG